MPNAPDAVIAAPLTIYLAPVGTAMPLIDDDPADFAVDWKVLGQEGSLNYDDSGVSVSHNETTSDFTPAGSTMPTKRFRTGESVSLSLNLVDVSPTEYAKVMNSASVTQVSSGSGRAGEDSFSLFRGDQVNSFAVLARGMSSVDNDLNQQYEFSKAFVSVNGNVTYKKGTPAMLPVTILAVKATAEDFIIDRVQTAVAS